MMYSFAFATTICLLANAALAAGQTPSTHPATAPATQPNVLDGPKVNDAAASQPTIVRRGFDGALEDVGGEADVAAVSALELTAEQRQKFDEILATRHAAFDDAVRSNYQLIVELASLQGESDQQKKLDALNKVRFAFSDFFKRGLFVDEFGSYLTDPQREQVNLMLNEYREAKIKQMQREHGLKQTQAAFRIRIEAFGRMVKDSIERQVVLEREQFEEISEQLNLTEEQKNKAQAIFGPLTVKRLQNIEVTPGERAAALGRFNRELNAEQREKLFAILVKQWLPKEPAAQPDSMQQ